MTAYHGDPVLKFLLCIIKNKKYTFIKKPRLCMRPSYSFHMIWRLSGHFHSEIVHFQIQDPSLCSSLIHIIHCLGCLFEGIFQFLSFICPLASSISGLRDIPGPITITNVVLVVIRAPFRTSRRKLRDAWLWDVALMIKDFDAECLLKPTLK